MKKGLSIFLIVIAIVITGVVVIDCCTGIVMSRLLPKIGNSGDTGRTYYSMYEVDDPVLVIGSSRASHHYVSQILSDSLGFPVRNIGRDGCFFSYNCCVINSILNRYTPKLIIWENGGEYLTEECRDPLENMYPYYRSDKYVYQCINSHTDILDRIPLYSNLYRYNSVIHRILMRYVSKSGDEDDGLNGYMPLKPREWEPVVNISTSNAMPPKISEVKVRQFISVLSRCKEDGVNIVVVDSPKYTRALKDRTSVDRMEAICDSLMVPFFDNTDMESFVGNLDLFNDNIHMNEIGAEKYTVKFIGQIAKVFDRN